MTGQRDTSSGELFSPDEVVSLLIDDDGLEQQFAAQQKAAGGSGAPAEKPHHIALRMTDGDEEAEKDEDDEDVEGDDDNDGEREGSGAAAGGSGGGGGKEAKVAGRKRVKAGHGGKSKAAAAPPGALTRTLTLLKSLLVVCGPLTPWSACRGGAEELARAQAQEGQRRRGRDHPHHVAAVQSAQGGRLAAGARGGTATSDARGGADAGGGGSDTAATTHVPVATRGGCSISQ